MKIKSNTRFKQTIVDAMGDAHTILVKPGDILNRDDRYNKKALRVGKDPRIGKRGKSRRFAQKMGQIALFIGASSVLVYIFV